MDNSGAGRIDITPSANTAVIASHDQIHNNDLICSSTNGTTAMTCSLPNKALPAYAANQCFDMLTDTDNPVSININNNGVVSLRLPDGLSTPPAGMVLHAQPFRACHNGTSFLVVAVSSQLLPGTIGLNRLASIGNNTLLANNSGGSASPIALSMSGLTLPNTSIGSGYLSTTKTVGTGGVTANTLVKLDTTGNVIGAAITDASVLGIAISTVPATNAVEVATRGIVNCLAENATTIGNIAVVGTTTGGYCRDSGQMLSTNVPFNAQILGRFLSAVAGGAAASVQFFGPGHFGGQISPGNNIGISGSTIRAGDKMTWGLCAVSNCTASDVVNNPYIFTGNYSVQNCYVAAGISPTGASLILQVKKNGSNAFTVVLTAGTANNTTLTSSPSMSGVTGDNISVAITQVGSTVAGANVTLACTLL